MIQPFFLLHSITRCYIKLLLNVVFLCTALDKGLCKRTLAFPLYAHSFKAFAGCRKNLVNVDLFAQV